MARRSAVEDYVRAIYAHTEWQEQRITTTELAARLGLAASSVTEMVKKLTAQGLVTHAPYGAIALTTDGTALALRMTRRHRLIETWLVDHFGYGWDEVHDEAEILEHALSDRLLDAIDDELGHPTRDPHGDPIPRRDGRIERPAATLLGELAIGRPGRVVRISDRDPDVLRDLGLAGVALDTVLEIEARDEGRSLRVARSGVRVELDAAAASSIWVSVDA
jgi:DtxR family Mn-dependent transcriptional regulator